VKREQRPVLGDGEEREEGRKKRGAMILRIYEMR
jgi:hypothetical protein